MHLLPDLPPLQWDRETYQSHIESVLSTTWSYEGKEHLLAMTPGPFTTNNITLYRIYWIKEGEYYLIHWFTELDQAIREFIGYEPIRIEER